MDMSVDIGGIRMANPVMVASGTFGYGPEYADLVDINRLGALPYDTIPVFSGKPLIERKLLHLDLVALRNA